MKRLIQWLKDLRKPRPCYEEIEAYRVANERLRRQVLDLAKQCETERNTVRRFEIAHSKMAAATGRPFEARETAVPPPFDDDDRTRWREFLATSTGRRLAQGLNWWAQYKEQQATLTTANQAWHCGEAAGYRAFGVWALHSLSADTRLQQGEDTRAQNGASDLRERIAP